MVNETSADLDAVFHALADPTRRAMLQQLTTGEQRVSALAAPFAMSLAGASKHIRVLERADLVRRAVRGRTHLCRLNPARLADAHRWLQRYEAFWNTRLDTLECLLRDEAANATRGHDRSNDD